MNLFAFSAADLNPISDIGSAFSSALRNFTGWLAGQVVHALSALLRALLSLIVQEMLTTTPQFAHTKFNAAQPTIFNPVWRVMVIVGVTFSVIIMAIGIISAVVQGKPGVLGKQMLLGLMGVLLMASPVIPDVVQALFDIINVFSRYILGAGLTMATHQALNMKMSLSSQITQLVGNALSGGAWGETTLLSAIVILFGCIAAVFIWFELLAREAIAYLVMAMVPLAVAGLFFKGTWTWIKKAIQGIIGVALAQIIIAVVLTLGMSSLLTSAKNNSITDAALFAVFLMIASLGLPMAMRVAPMAMEFGEAALVGGEIAQMARSRAVHHATSVGKKAAGGFGGGAGGVGPGAGSPLVGSLARGGGMAGRAGDVGATSGGGGPKGPKGPTPGGLHDQMASAIESTPAKAPNRTSNHPSAGSTPPKPRPSTKPSGPHYLRPIDKNDPQKPTPKPPRRPPGSGPEPKNKETQ